MQRITPLMTQSTLLTQLEQSATTLNTTVGQISTGLKITKPSDDPYGAGLTMQLKAQATELDTYNTSVQDAGGWADTTSSQLSTINQAVQRIRELTVEAANGTFSQADLQASAAEVNQLIDGIKQSADATYDNQYVFSGTATGTPPYQLGAVDTFAGNTGTIQHLIAPATTVQANTDISQLLGNGQGAGDGKLLDTLRTVAADMAAGNHSALSADLTGIDANLSTLSTMQVTVGITQSQLTQASSRILDLQDTNTKLLANTQGVDMAQAMTSYTTQQAAYTAALQVSAQILQKDSLLNFLS